MICSNHKIVATYVHRVILELKQIAGGKPWGFFINCRLHSAVWGLLLKFRIMQVQAFPISQIQDHSSVLNKEFRFWGEYLQRKEIETEHSLCTQETHKLMRMEKHLRSIRIQKDMVLLFEVDEFKTHLQKCSASFIWKFARSLKFVEPWLDATLLFASTVRPWACWSPNLCASSAWENRGGVKKAGKKQQNATNHMAEKEDGENFAMSATVWSGMNENASMEL